MLKSHVVQALASFPQTACQLLVNKKTGSNLCQLFILQVSCITKMTTNFSWTFCSFLITFQDIFKGCKTFYSIYCSIATFRTFFFFPNSFLSIFQCSILKCKSNIWLPNLCKSNAGCQNDIKVILKVGFHRSDTFSRLFYLGEITENYRIHHWYAALELTGITDGLQ